MRLFTSFSGQFTQTLESLVKHPRHLRSRSKTRVLIISRLGKKKDMVEKNAKH